MVEGDEFGKYVVSIDEIEECMVLDFLSVLLDEVEVVLELKCVVRVW